MIGIMRHMAPPRVLKQIFKHIQKQFGVDRARAEQIAARMAR